MPLEFQKIINANYTSDFKILCPTPPIKPTTAPAAINHGVDRLSLITFL